MPATFAAVTKFTAIDRISGVFKNMGRASEKFGNKAERSFLKASKAGSRFKDVTKGILTAGAISRGLGLIERGISAAATEFVSFDDSITAATARFKDVEAGSAQAAKTMELLRKAARKAGSETQFSASQAAQGLDFFARAGFTSAEAMGVLKSQIDLATATGEDFARVADISSDLLGALGLNAQDSATKIGNLRKMNNLLAVATNSANVTMEDLFETIKVAGPIASRAGESQEKIIAMTAALGSSGIKGSMGATALKNAYIRLLDVTPKVSKALAGVGLSSKDFVDQTGKMKSMTDIMALLGKRTAKLGSADQLKFFSVVFGKMAVAGSSNLSKSLSQVDKTLKAMEDSRAMEKIAEQMRTSLGPRLQIIKSGLLEIAFKIFTAFEKRGKSALDRITTAIQKFDPAPIIAGIEKAIILVKLLGSLAKILTPVIVAMVAYKVATLSAVAATWAFAAFTKAQIFFILAKSIGFASTAMHLLNVALWANPIGLIVAGVVALGAALFVVIKYWDTIISAIGKAVSLSAQFIGIGGGDSSGGTTAPTTEAPNKKEAGAKAEKGFFEGLFSFDNPPENMKFESKGAPKIDTSGLGKN